MVVAISIFKVIENEPVLENSGKWLVFTVDDFAGFEKYIVCKTVYSSVVWATESHSLLT